MLLLGRNWQVSRVSSLSHFRDFTVHLCIKKNSNLITSSAFYRYVCIYVCACKTILQKRDISTEWLKERKTMQRNNTLSACKTICNKIANPLGKEHGDITIRNYLSLKQWPYINKTWAPAIQIKCWIPNGTKYLKTTLANRLNEISHKIVTVFFQYRHRMLVLPAGKKKANVFWINLLY